MASKKQAAAAAENAVAVPEGHVVVYPTHKRSAGPLVLALPAVDGESAEIVIGDDGAAVPQSTADFLVAAGEASLSAPEKAED
jgi:hypothetical protein